MRTVIAVTMYFAQIFMYILGGKALFGVRYRHKWLPFAGGGVLVIFLAVIQEAEKQYKGIFLCIYFVACIFAIIMIEGKFRERVIIALSVLCISACTDAVFGILLDHILSPSEHWQEIQSILETVLTTIVLVFWYRIKNMLSVNTEKLQSVVKKNIIIVIIGLGICQSLTIAGLIYVRNYLPNEREKFVFEIFGIMSFIGMAGIIIFILYIQITNEKMEQLLVTERELKKMQELYYTILLDREADTRKYRHDMNNHLLCLYELSKKEKIEEIKEYIFEMEKSFSVVQRKCYVTGNDVLDILFNYHLASLQDVNVSVFGQCSKKVAISDMDFCTIVSNILQNAVEEVKRQKEDNRYIKVKLQEGEQYFSINIKNSSKFVWQGTEKKIETVKKDKKNHGIGLENARETIRKNHGSLKLSGDGKEVTAIVILPYD